MQLEEECESTAIQAVARHGSSETIQILLDAGADLNANTGESLSPIVLAVRAGNLAAVQVLVKSGSFAR